MPFICLSRYHQPFTTSTTTQSTRATTAPGAAVTTANDDADGDRPPLLPLLSLEAAAYPSYSSHSPRPETTALPPQHHRLPPLLTYARWRWRFRLAVLSAVLSTFLYYVPGMFLEVFFVPARGVMLPSGLASLTYEPLEGTATMPEDDGKRGGDDDNSVRIPRIVHVTYKSREELPADWEHGLRRWEEVHPDWTVRFWTDDDIAHFVHEEFPEMEAFHKSYKYTIQRVDAMRYMILQRYGGIYSDMDIFPAANLEPLLRVWERDGKSVLLAESLNGGVTNAFMAAAPGSNFFTCAIANLPRYRQSWHHFIGWRHWEVLSSAGSTYLWGMVGQCRAGRAEKGEAEVRVLAASSFRGCSVCESWKAGKKYQRPTCDTEWLRHSSTNSSWHQSAKSNWFHAAWLTLTYSLLCWPWRACFLVSWITMTLVNRRSDRRGSIKSS